MERHARACRLAGDPHGRRPHRPPGQLRHDRHTGADQRDEERLDRDQGEPGARPDLHTGPHQQRQQEAQAEEVAEAEPRLPAAAAQHPAEGGEGRRGEPPQGAGREADVEEQAGERGSGGREEAHEPPGPRRPCPGRDPRLQLVRLVDGGCGDGHSRSVSRAPWAPTARSTGAATGLRPPGAGRRPLRPPPRSNVPAHFVTTHPQTAHQPLRCAEVSVVRPSAVRAAGSSEVGGDGVRGAGRGGCQWDDVCVRAGRGRRETDRSGRGGRRGAGRLRRLVPDHGGRA